MATREEIKLKAYRLFCQHCQALQKVMGWKGKPCWVTQYNEPEAVCASAIDAIDGLFDYLHSQGVVIKAENQTIEVEIPADGKRTGLKVPYHLENLGKNIVAVELLIKEQ